VDAISRSSSMSRIVLLAGSMFVPSPRTTGCAPS
jgi:hypothetical protein